MLLTYRPHLRADGAITTPDLLIDRAVVMAEDRSLPVHDLRARCFTSRGRGDVLTPAIGVLGGRFGPIVMPTLLVGGRGSDDTDRFDLALLSRDAHRLAVPLDPMTELRLSIDVDDEPRGQGAVTGPEAERSIEIAAERRGVVFCIAVADLSVPTAAVERVDVAVTIAGEEPLHLQVAVLDRAEEETTGENERTTS